MLLPDLRPYGLLIDACGTKLLSRDDAELSSFMILTQSYFLPSLRANSIAGLSKGILIVCIP